MPPNSSVLDPSAVLRTHTSSSGNSKPATLLSSLPPERIENPLAKKTWTATAIGAVGVGCFLAWFYHVYRGYMLWYRYHKQGDTLVLAETGGLVPSLPETSIVKVGIPVFILSIFIEWLISLAMGYYENYRVADTVASFSNGLLQMLVELVTTMGGEYLGLQLITAIPYRWIYENFGLTKSLEGNWMGFVFMWFARDLGYYWFHRAAHRAAFMWAVHGVHHSPNEFNYSVNLCQGALQRITSVVFYAPLALFCPPELYQIIFPMEKIYGFMTHTRLVNKMYGISYFFVTPSTHRVHHAGAPAKYIDKNYGEMLTIWDRMFGTHEEEEEMVVFGHVHPLDTWNPVEAQLRVWKEIWAKARTCSSIVDKALCFIMPPGWNPHEGGEYPLPDYTPYSAQKYDSNLPWVMSFYLFAWFVPSISLGIFILHSWRSMTNLLLFTLMLYNIYCLFCLGSLADRNPRALVYECVRMVVTVPLVYWALPKVGVSLDQAMNSLLVLGAVCALSFFIVIAHNSCFVKETPDQRKERVWIREAGREFTRMLTKELKTE